MTSRMQDVLTCPICFELYRKPVLALPCQHNLCQICIMQLLEKELLKNRCPTCRREFSLGAEGINGLPRNYLVEEMVDEVKKSETTVQTEKQTAYPTSETSTIAVLDIPTLAGMAKESMGKKKFEEAKKILEKIKKHVQGLLFIEVHLDILRCCLEIKSSKTIYEHGKSSISALSGVSLSVKDRETAVRLIRQCVKDLSRENANVTAINLLKFASDICEAIEEPAKQLEEQMQCLELMQGITKSMARQDMKQEFKDFAFPTIHHIYHYITRIHVDAPSVRCIKIAWCLKYIGMCCNEIGDYPRSVEYNKRAINHLEEHLRKQASFYRVYGVSYHNLAAAYKNSNKYVDAKAAYLRAIEAYYQAKDWPSEERRNNSVTLSAIGLSEAHRLLKK